MWSSLQTRTARTLLSGVAVATASGLMLGAALQPDLRGDGVLAPQTLIAGGGPRDDAVADPGLARYAGRIPESVIGTDWTRPPPLIAEAHRSEPVDAVVYSSRDQLPEFQPTRAAWRDEPPKPVTFPSSDGGVFHETDLPEAPLPPDDDDPG